MARAPGSAKAQILIAKRAGERDMSNIDFSGRRRLFEMRERALDLAALQRNGVGVTKRLWACDGFVTDEQCGVVDPVSERLQLQRVEAPCRVGREQLSATRKMIEIFRR